MSTSESTPDLGVVPDGVRYVSLGTGEDYVILPDIQGWRLQFIPSDGPFAGEPISRVFIVPAGRLGEAKRVCRIRYGSATHILAGAALHNDEKFGDWDE